MAHKHGKRDMAHIHGKRVTLLYCQGKNKTSMNILTLPTSVIQFVLPSWEELKK